MYGEGGREDRQCVEGYTLGRNTRHEKNGRENGEDVGLHCKSVETHGGIDKEQRPTGKRVQCFLRERERDSVGAQPETQFCRPQDMYGSQYRSFRSQLKSVEKQISAEPRLPEN